MLNWPPPRSPFLWKCLKKAFTFSKLIVTSKLLSLFKHDIYSQMLLIFNQFQYWKNRFQCWSIAHVGSDARPKKCSNVIAKPTNQTNPRWLKMLSHRSQVGSDNSSSVYESHMFMPWQMLTVGSISGQMFQNSQSSGCCGFWHCFSFSLFFWECSEFMTCTPGTWL